jgi:DNA polymerase V
VFVETNPFKPSDPQYGASRAARLPVATADTGRIVKAAGMVLQAIWRRGFSYKKAGVMLIGLTKAGLVQGDLWVQPDTPAAKRLMRSIDALNAHHGRATIGYASAGVQNAWKLRREFISPRYTTCWDELLKV